MNPPELPDFDQMLTEIIQQHLNSQQIHFVTSQNFQLISSVIDNQQSANITQHQMPSWLPDLNEQDEVQQEQDQLTEQLVEIEQQIEQGQWEPNEETNTLSSQLLTQLREMVQQFQLPGISIHLEAYMQEQILQESEEETLMTNQISAQKFKTPIIVKELPQECYICLLENTQFNETCGEQTHIICSECFDKIKRFKGCPMCRKDLLGFIGRDTMTSFFENNSQLFENLYNYYKSDQCTAFQFKITCNFGEFEDKDDFIKQVKKRCLDIVEQICNNQNDVDIPLFQKLVNNPSEICPTTLRYLADTLLYNYE